jgi:large subunit ribosomal protein L15
MDLSNLKPANGSNRGKRRRHGRGSSSGYGDACGRGVKGARSRSGYKRRFGYEGGQMPHYRRMPKFGFHNPNKVQYIPLNLGQLEQLADKYNFKTVDPETLKEHKIIGRNDKVKVLGSGKLSKKLTVKAHAFSKTGKKGVESAGGTAKVISTESKKSKKQS